MKHYLKIIGSTLGIASSLYGVDIDLSGFGTIGGAISDKPYTYQRFINDGGTLNKDSVFGLQSTLAFNPQWSATVQGKVAPSKESDQNWDVTVPWAFVSYRPTNDWLIRAGKIRMPLYLNSQNIDVGVTYNMARLPYEVYSLSPEDNALGVIVTKSFAFESGELLADAFYAKVTTPYRVYMRDDLSAYSVLGGRSKGANFHDIKFDIAGLSLAYETEEGDRFRAGFYKSITQGADKGGNFSLQAPTMLNTVISPFVYPFSYYQPDNWNKDEIIAFTVGADIGLGNGYRITSEYAMRKMLDADTGPNSQSAYIALSKTIDKWTPYLSLACLKTSDNVKNLYSNLNNDTVNLLIPVNRQYADYVIGAEQNSVALGFSYAISPTQKVKAEWSHARIGSMSNFLVDNTGSQAISNENINVFSLSYSMSF